MKFLKIVLIIIAIWAFGNFMMWGQEKDWENSIKRHHALTDQNRITVHSFVDFHSTSTEKIGLLMGKDKVEFWISRNYLEDAGLMPKSNFFKIIMLYPNFIGTNNYNVEQLKSWHWKESPNMIIMMGFEDAEHKKTATGEHDPTKHIFSFETGKPLKPWKYGLYESHFDQSIADTYIYPDTKKRKGFFVSCLKETPSEQLHTCDSQIRVSDDVEVTVQYHRSLLPHALEINDRVRQMLQSFIVNRKVNL